MRQFAGEWAVRLRRFALDTTGGVAITFAISALAATMLVGGGIDYSRATNAREKLQWAVDGAALAAKRKQVDTQVLKGLSASKKLGEEDGNQVFLANVAKLGTTFVDGSAQATFEWGAPGNAAKVTGVAKVKLVFGGVLGYTYFDLKSYAEVALGDGGIIEVSLVLDNTASMFTKDGRADTRFTLLRNASKTFTNTLFDKLSLPDNLRIAVVPWATTVNVRSEAPRAPDSGGKQSNVIADRGSRKPLSSANLIDRSLTVNYDDSDYFPVNWRGCVSGATDNTGVNDNPLSSTTRLSALRIKPMRMWDYEIGDTTTSQNVWECTVYDNSTCPTGGGGGGGLNPFAPAPLAVPIVLRNIAPHVFPHEGEGKKIGCGVCTQMGLTDYRPDCKLSTPIKRMVKCYQDTSGGSKNYYMNGRAESFFSSDYHNITKNKCIKDAGYDPVRDMYCALNRPYAPAYTDANGVYRDAVYPIENYDDLSNCVSDPNEIGYSGNWCPWLPSNSWTKYTPGVTAISGPNLNCPMPMLGLSGNRTQVLETIDRMSPVPGGTHADVGLRWGMRSLSPVAEWSSFFGTTGRPPLPWTTTTNSKYMILITDGENTPAVDVPGYWGCEHTPSINFYGEKFCDGTKTVSELNSAMLSWCTAIRNKGVKLYTIALNLSNTKAAKDAADALKTCAGDDTRALSIDSSELETTLQKIADSMIAKQLYLRR